jgi:hypothetical protein
VSAPNQTAAVEGRLERALAAVDAWQGAQIRWAPAVVPVASPMRRGVAGACFRVEVAGHGAYFVKLVQDEVACFVDLTATADASAKAAALGVAPPMRFALPDQGALIYDYLPEPWRHAHVRDLADRGVLESVLAAKKRIHQGPPFARTRSILGAIDDVAGRAHSDGAPLPPDYPWMLANLGDIRAALLAAGSDLAPCHGDGVASNVMLAPDGGVRLVGFYSAANSDPLHDLGSLFVEAFQFDDEAQAALEIYCGRADARTFNRCRLYGILDDLYWGTWGLYVAHSSARRTVEFFKYGQWRLLRCRMGMNDWRFEEWLRKI